MVDRGLVSNLQKYSLHDGPGIRTTVFLQGCPLACAWCHNPETRPAGASVVFAAARCIRCGECLPACPRGCAEAIADRGDRCGCLACGACVEACPTGARQLAGRRMTVAEVLAEIEKDGPFYDDSGGGVTFSGGEPLAQGEFLKSLLEACRRREMHTAVDTSGYAPREQLLAVAPLVDLFLYDLKFLDEAKHVQYTGVSNGLILENLRALGRVHGNLWIRIPVVPGINDRPEEIEGLVWLAASVPGVRQVNLLPYHRTALHKFQRLAEAYPLAEIAAASPESMRAMAEGLRASGLEIKVGG
jgi:pyruvate formate lyase activating enzyme